MTLKPTIKAWCIDPGTKSSALVKVEVARHAIRPPWGVVPGCANDLDNEDLRQEIWSPDEVPPELLIIETMPTVFQGAAARDQLVAERWAGRFIEAYHSSRKCAGKLSRVIQCSRQSARAATIGRARGTDSEVRRALIDAYGGDSVAFGVKCPTCKGKGWKGRGRPPCGNCTGSGWDIRPGPLHNFKGSHVYAALALSLAVFQPGGLFDEQSETCTSTNSP